MAATPQDLRRERRTGAIDRRANPVTLARPLNLDGIRVSWGGIWGGVLTAIGVLLLLAALGMAVGASATPAEADGTTLGMAAGVWAGVSLLIALFLGGMVSTRIGATYDGATGFWEGALVWIVTLLAIVGLATTGLSSLMGGAMRVMGTTSQVASAMQGTPAAAKAAWGTFGALVLMLLASVLGAVAGRRRHPWLERR
jgi:hypothetical protein